MASASLLPSYGGPAYSVSRLAVALVQAGAEVGLWAADQSARAVSLPSAGTSIERLRGNANESLDAFGRPDVIHDSGIWLPHNHRLAALAQAEGIRRIVSTRGMLEPWARRHKRVKKAIAWRLFQRSDLRRAAMLHATSNQEKENIERIGIGVPLCMIPNGVDLPTGVWRVPHQAGNEVGARVALFVGRIYPVKGLPMLVEAWARIGPAGWRLHIVGPDEGGHRAEVQRAVVRAGLSDVVSFVGPLTGEAKTAALRSAELLVLPSYSESFGIAVAEGLAHGLPVLTTTGTPWSGLVERGCGWWVTPNEADIGNALRQATSMDRGMLIAMGLKGRAWIEAEFGWDAVAARFGRAYEALLTNCGA